MLWSGLSVVLRSNVKQTPMAVTKAQHIFICYFNI